MRDVLHYYSAAPERLFGRQIPVAGGVDLTFREPLGVVGVIVPWNFPMPIASWGLAPALAAGNTVVLKPAELTPLTALRLAELALEAGLPDGVLQVLPGKGAVVGQRLVEHPDVRKIVFTGSTEVGRQVHGRRRGDGEAGDAGAGRQERRTSSSPTPTSSGPRPPRRPPFSTTPGRTAAPAPGSSSSARCTSASCSCWSPPCSASGSATRRPPSTQMGPLISAAHRETVASYVPADAPVALRGSAPAGPGYWFPPTVLAPVSPRDRVAAEEIFGPVVAVDPVRRRGRRGPAGQRLAVRAVGFDLDPGRGPGAAGGAGGRHGQPVGQLALLGPLLDPVRRVQAAPASAASSGPTRSTPSPRSRTCSSATE